MFEIPADDDDHPIKIYTELCKLERFEDLRQYEPDVAFIFRNDEKVKAGKRILGTVYLPQVQGELSPLFDWMLENTIGMTPVFLFMLDHEFWREADAGTREALMFHEMCHCTIKEDRYGVPLFNRDTGEPRWALKAHDIEAFDDEVRRYGAWKSDIASFLAAGGVVPGESQNG